jgi:hypothetical protein
LVLVPAAVETIRVPYGSIIIFFFFVRLGIVLVIIIPRLSISSAIAPFYSFVLANKPQLYRCRVKKIMKKNQHNPIAGVGRGWWPRKVKKDSTQGYMWWRPNFLFGPSSVPFGKTKAADTIMIAISPLEDKLDPPCLFSPSSTTPMAGKASKCVFSNPDTQIAQESIINTNGLGQGCDSQLFSLRHIHSLLLDEMMIHFNPLGSTPVHAGMVELLSSSSFGKLVVIVVVRQKGRRVFYVSRPSHGRPDRFSLSHCRGGCHPSLSLTKAVRRHFSRPVTSFIFVRSPMRRKDRTKP